MPHATSHLLLVMGRRSLGFAVGFAICLPLLAFSQSADEANLRTLADKFFAAYQKEDMDGLMALWSEKSPDLAASKKDIQQTFAAVAKIELKSLTVRRVIVDGARATVRVVVEMHAVDSKTGKAAAGFGKLNRTLHSVKEDRDWKLSRCVPSEEDLAAALVAAKTEKEREALLTLEKELVTIELQKALVAQGHRLLSQASVPQAGTTYQLALNMAEQLGDKTGTVAALHGLGSVNYFQGNYVQALGYYQNSLKLAEELGDKAEVSRLLSNVGSIYYSQGNYAKALEYYQKSLLLMEETNSKVGAARTQQNIGSVYYSQGNFGKALEYYQKTLTVQEELHNKEDIALALNNIGVVYDSQGDSKQALEYYHRSLRLVEELNDKAKIAGTLNNIGIVHEARGNYAKALEYYQKGMKLAEELGSKEDICHILSSIGNIHELQGNYAQALTYQVNSLKVAEQLGNKSRIAVLLNDIGSLYSLQGKYILALEYCHNSLELKKELGDKVGIGYALRNIGNVHYLQANYAKALEYHQNSLKLSEEIGSKALASNTLVGIARVYESQANHAKALDLADRSAAIAREIGNPEGFWNARTIAGRAYRAINQPEQARRAFDEAIDSIEELRGQVAGGEQEQQRFFESRVSPYYAMVCLLSDQNNDAEALAYAERAKGRVLLDVLRSGRVNISKATTQVEQEQERKLNRDIVSLNTQIYREKLQQQPNEKRLADLDARLHKGRLEYEAFQTSLYAAHPELKSQRGETSPLTLKEASALIPDAHTALLEFVVMEDKTYLFVLTRNKDTNQAVPDLKVYKLETKQKDLADRAQRFRQRLASHDFSFYDLASQLYDLLLKPARAQLQNITTLVIVPDGVLWELPFQALQPARNRYLIENYAISYAPSLTVLREMMKPRVNRTHSTTAFPTLLAFGNPAIGKETAERVKSVFMDEQLLPLPEAERQVRMLGRLYGAARSKVYVGTEAREDRAKLEAGSFRMLHLATHGILNNASPIYSHLILSQAQAGGGEDGLLEAWEIMNLELNAELVVLSACDTARGRVGAGEGVIGLAWAFFVAGCPTTVASQWKVESTSTTELMVELHRNLKARMENPMSRTSKAETLRLAALKLLRSKQYRHPFYWAGFVMIGDGW